MFAAAEQGEREKTPRGKGGSGWAREHHRAPFVLRDWISVAPLDLHLRSLISASTRSRTTAY
jgi:hypothetical protein